MLWESSLCSFHTGFLLSPLTFPVPEERLIPCRTTLAFVFTSRPGFFAPRILAPQRLVWLAEVTNG